MISAGLHHVSINVTDTAVTRDFYIDMFGFTELARPDLGFAGAWLQIGQQQLHLLELPMPEHKGQHFALAVTDIDSAIAQLRAQGVKVADPTEIAGICRQAFLFDPAGNQIELNQPL